MILGHLSNEQRDPRLVWLYRGIILPTGSYMGITINHYKGILLNNQYFMESKARFFSRLTSGVDIKRCQKNTRNILSQPGITA